MTMCINGLIFGQNYLLLDKVRSSKRRLFYSFIFFTFFLDKTAVDSKTFIVLAKILNFVTELSLSLPVGPKLF